MYSFCNFLCRVIGHYKVGIFNAFSPELPITTHVDLCPLSHLPIICPSVTTKQ